MYRHRRNASLGIDGNLLAGLLVDDDLVWDRSYLGGGSGGGRQREASGTRAAVCSAGPFLSDFNAC